MNPFEFSPSSHYSYSSTPHAFQAHLSETSQLDLHQLTAHITLTLHALERAKWKFMTQFILLLLAAIVSLSYHLYQVYVSIDEQSSSDVALLVFGSCTVLLLISIASGTFSDRIHGSEKYQLSLNRWLSLFGMQWKRGALVVDELPKESPQPTNGTFTTPRTQRDSSSTPSSSRSTDTTTVRQRPSTASALSEYEARKRSGIESGWIHQSPYDDDRPTIDEHPRRHSRTSKHGTKHATENDTLQVPGTVIVSGSTDHSHSSASSSTSTDSTLAVPSVSSAAPRTSPSSSRQHSMHINASASSLSVPTSPTAAAMPLTPADAKFLHSSVWSPDQDASDSSLQPPLMQPLEEPTIDPVTHQPSVPTEMERVIQEMKRSKSMELDQIKRQ